MRVRWFTPRAIGLHVTVAICVPGFLYLGWWQLHRALGGNWLSWAYTFEWPLFSGYAIYMWWRLVHEIAADRDPEPETGAGKAVEHDDAELDAYNAYLAELAAEDSAPPRPTSGNDHR